MGKTRFDIAGLPVCGQCATAAIISDSSRCLNLCHFVSAAGQKLVRGGTRGQGRVLPCAAEQDKTDIVEANYTVVNLCL
jgi:hypothetical protein